MDNFGKELDDLLDLTDTDETSSSSDVGIFDSNQPLVLELHELKKDQPPTDTVETAQAETKRKRKKRKRNQPAVEDQSSTSSTSIVSDSVATLADSAGKEEFYDANESYHALSVENSQVNPAASAMMAQAHSEQERDKRERQEIRAPATNVSSTISKPVAPPD